MTPAASQHALQPWDAEHLVHPFTQGSGRSWERQQAAEAAEHGSASAREGDPAIARQLLPLHKSPIQLHKYTSWMEGQTHPWFHWGGTGYSISQLCLRRPHRQMSLQSPQVSGTSTTPWCNMNLSLGETIDAIKSQKYQQASSVVLILIPFSFAFMHLF